MRSLDRPSRVVAHFSVDVDIDQKTLLDGDGFIKALESALEDRTRSLLEGLRQRQNQQRQSEETAASVKLNLIAESDGTCGAQKRSPDALSESTGECCEESCLLTEQLLLSHIEFVAPGSAFVDLTSVSILSALLTPFPADSNEAASGVQALSTHVAVQITSLHASLNRAAHCKRWQHRNPNGGIALSGHGLG
jgi:hypothetical protein